MAEINSGLALNLAALLTPTIAIVGVIFAYLQWRTNERKRQNDLFDRRYEFYKNLKDFYIAIQQEGPSPDDLDLIPYCEEASFIFGDDIAKHISKLLEHEAPTQVEYGYVDDWFIKPFEKYLKL